MWRSPSAGEGLRVLAMSETMQQMMAREQEEAIASLMKANRALERIFGVQWQEGDDGTGVCDMCAGCPNCVQEEESNG